MSCVLVENGAESSTYRSLIALTCLIDLGFMTSVQKIVVRGGVRTDSPKIHQLLFFIRNRLSNWLDY
jgi:hypothetical protein